MPLILWDSNNSCPIDVISSVLPYVVHCLIRSGLVSVLDAFCGPYVTVIGFLHFVSFSRTKIVQASMSTYFRQFLICSGNRLCINSIRRVGWTNELNKPFFSSEDILGFLFVPIFRKSDWKINSHYSGSFHVQEMILMKTFLVGQDNLPNIILDCILKRGEDVFEFGMYDVALPNCETILDKMKVRCAVSRGEIDGSLIAGIGYSGEVGMRENHFVSRTFTGSDGNEQFYISDGMGRRGKFPRV